MYETLEAKFLRLLKEGIIPTGLLVSYGQYAKIAMDQGVQDTDLTLTPLYFFGVRVYVANVCDPVFITTHEVRNETHKW